MAKKSASAEPLYWIGWIVCLLLLGSTIASLFGLYYSHVVYGQLIFGDSNSSLALIAFAINVALWAKSVRYCLSDEKR